MYMATATDEDALYYKIYDMLLVLRNTRDRFQTYSPKDIKGLIASKMKSIREPLALKELYELESMITDLRFSLMTAKENKNLISSIDS